MASLFGDSFVRRNGRSIFAMRNLSDSKRQASYMRLTVVGLGILAIILFLAKSGAYNSEGQPTVTSTESQSVQEKEAALNEETTAGEISEESSTVDLGGVSSSNQTSNKLPEEVPNIADLSGVSDKTEKITSEPMKSEENSELETQDEEISDESNTSATETEDESVSEDTPSEDDTKVVVDALLGQEEQDSKATIAEGNNKEVGEEVGNTDSDASADVEGGIGSKGEGQSTQVEQDGDKGDNEESNMELPGKEEDVIHGGSNETEEATRDEEKNVEEDDGRKEKSELRKEQDIPEQEADKESGSEQGEGEQKEEEGDESKGAEDVQEGMGEEEMESKSGDDGQAQAGEAHSEGKREEDNEPEESGSNMKNEVAEETPEESHSSGEQQVSTEGEDATVSADGAGGGSESDIQDTDVDCTGKKIHIYKLPAVFNRAMLLKCDTILPWYSLCSHFVNYGLGQAVQSTETLVPVKRWYETHQYGLEIYLHKKLKRTYPCLTDDSRDADLYYIPFYATLDAARWQFAQNATLDQRDHLAHYLTRWLKARPAFKKSGGADHVLPIGSSTWDFRRTATSAEWGTILLEIPELKQVTKLVVERDIWDEKEIGIPPLSYFHPKTDKDLATWQKRLRKSQREMSVSFVAFPPSDAGLKEVLSKQCKENSDVCRYMQCVEDVCSRPSAIMGIFLSSTFCLIPPGDTGVRRAVFHALQAGCIPVVFDDFHTGETQFPWHLPSDRSTYSLHLPPQKTRQGEVDVITKLQEFPKKKAKAMREYIISDVIPKLIYKHPLSRPSSTFVDAFDVIMEKLLERAVVPKGSGNENTKTSAQFY